MQVTGIHTNRFGAPIVLFGGPQESVVEAVRTAPLDQFGCWEITRICAGSAIRVNHGTQTHTNYANAALAAAQAHQLLRRIAASARVS